MTGPATDRLVKAYERMMERLRRAADEAESRTLPSLRHSLEKARETAVELEELSRDEAEKVSYYVKRDLRDVGRHLAETGDELSDWLRFDISRIENGLLDLFAQVADRTRLEWLELQNELRRDPPYHSGEITGPGTLYCSACNAALHFHQTARIPVCPRCGNESFRRWPIAKGSDT
ncbi:MAG: zinc ribbon-containing protein [Gammaproteobacteria bacterium]